MRTQSSLHKYFRRDSVRVMAAVGATILGLLTASALSGLPVSARGGQVYNRLNREEGHHSAASSRSSSRASSSRRSSSRSSSSRGRTTRRSSSSSSAHGE